MSEGTVRLTSRPSDLLPGRHEHSGSPRTTILFVDQGAAFGGSIVVAANLICQLDRTKFRCVLVGEVDKGFIQHHVGSVAEIHVVRHAFNYVDWMRASRSLKRIKPWLFRAPIALLLSLFRVLVNIPYLCRLLLIALRARADLIHINNGAENFEANMLSLVIRRPQVVHVHGLEPLSRARRWFMRRVSKVVAISEAVASTMRSEGVPPSSIDTIPNPVAPRRIPTDARTSVRRRLGIGLDAPVFGIVGRVVPWKGQKEFLDAAALILKQRPDARAMIVGDSADGADDYIATLRKFIAEHGLDGKVMFTGFTRDVVEMYAAMDVAVHSSIEPEPFGLVITEAMSYSLPVVASTLGAPVEIIQDGITGYLVHPTDAETVAARVVGLFADSNLRTSMGRRAQEYVLQKYDAARYAEAVARVYQAAIHGRCATTSNDKKVRAA